MKTIAQTLQREYQGIAVHYALLLDRRQRNGWVNGHHTSMKTRPQLHPAAILYGTDPVDGDVPSVRLSIWCHVAGTMSVTGFDNIPFASAFSPGLTAVALPITEPATLSAGLLNLAHSS